MTNMVVLSNGRRTRLAYRTGMKACLGLLGALMAACALVFALTFLPGAQFMAWAAEADASATGATSEEAAPASDATAEAESAPVDIAPADASSDGEVEHDQEEVDGVIVSAEEDAALIDGCSFGLTDFYRAQAGSNKRVGDAYYGYNYYVGTEPVNLACVAGNGRAVVYVSPEACERFGIAVDNADDQALLERYLVALDTVNAKGSSRLETIGEWRFTDEDVFELDGVKFSFSEELTEGRYYTCIIGADGADVTVQSHENYYKPDFADFASIVPADEVTIVMPLTGFAWLADFLANMDYSPLWVTLKTTGTAIIFIFILGLAAAYFTMRIPSKAQDIFDSIFTIPMVLPPTVCGFILLLACGSNTAFGRFFIDIGFPLVFSWQATVIAAIVVAFPLMYRNCRGAFENLDPNMLNAARTLGWSNAKIFFKLMVPLSWSSIAAATVLSFARALGEFGATLFMAGNFAGITRTIPIAIYFQWMNGDIDVAIFWTIVIIVFSFVVILFINLWSRRTTKYRRGGEQE